ncbi:MAG: PDZ domain-containing protein [Planctomycetes bacterium]|nr:PDZ domain-containing protein [Planctomycetota bacterium]
MQERKLPPVALARPVLGAAAAVLAIAAATATAQRIAPLNQDRHSPVVRVFDTARGAVVNISTTRMVDTRSRFFGFDDLPDDVFLLPGLLPGTPVNSLGSGFVIHPAGYVVTNEHVIRKADEITVILADGTSHPAAVISTDTTHDLAVLQVDLPDGAALPALPLGRSDDLMIGETVIAIGNPKGYRHSVTSGVVSALNRDLRFGNNVQYTGLIQTDASINPGNSGGPLLNVNAEVIGINTAIRPDAQGIGFAISVDNFRQLLPRLLDYRRIHRVQLGLEFGEERTAGAPGRPIVTALADDGPAGRAGVQIGDVIEAMDDQPVATVADLYVCMLQKSAGDTVAVRVRRGGGVRELRLTVEGRPRPDGEALARRVMGAALMEVTGDLARRYRLPLARGLVVTEVDPGSAAAATGLQPRDVLFEIGQSRVATLDDIALALEDLPAGAAIRIGVARGNVRAWTVLRTAPPDDEPRPREREYH